MANNSTHSSIYQNIVDTHNRALGTASQMEAVSSEAAETAKQKEVSHAAVMAASTTATQSAKNVVDAESVLTGITQGIEIQQKAIGKATVDVSGVELTSAQVAEPLAARTRQNYREAVGDPAVDLNIKRYQSQVNIYSNKMDALLADTSFMGGIKRAALEGPTRRRLNQANADLQSANQRKVQAATTLNATLNAGNNLAVSSTAVQRAQANHGLVIANSAMNILTKKALTQDQKITQLKTVTQLNDKYTAHFMKEYEFLKEKGVASASLLSSLSQKLYAQQIQAQTLVQLKGTQDKVEAISHYEEFVNSELGAEEGAKFLKLNPDHTAKGAADVPLITSYLISIGQQGTGNERLATLLYNKASNLDGLSENDHTVLRVDEYLQAQEREKLDADIATKRIEFRALPAQLKSAEAEYTKSLRELETDITARARRLEGAKTRQATNATAAIHSGAFFVRNQNIELTNPDSKYSQMISDEFKAILLSDEFKSIDLGFNRDTKLVSQIDSQFTGIAEYLNAVGNQEVLSGGGRDFPPRLLMDADTNKRIDILVEGLTQYYTVQRQQNLRSDSIYNEVSMPAIVVPGASAVQGKPLNLESASDIKALILRKLQTGSVNAGNL